MTLQQMLFASTAVASLVTFGVHTFVGGKFVARPLLADHSLPAASKWLNYYCWHITTVLLAAMAIAFAFLTMRPDQFALGVFMTTNAAAFSGLSAAVAVKGRINPLRFPSTTLFAIVAALGGAALLAGGGVR